MGTLINNVGPLTCGSRIGVLIPMLTGRMPPHMTILLIRAVGAGVAATTVGGNGGFGAMGDGFMVRR